MPVKKHSVEQIIAKLRGATAFLVGATVILTAEQKGHRLAIRIHP